MDRKTNRNRFPIYFLLHSLTEVTAVQVILLEVIFLNCSSQKQIFQAVRLIFSLATNHVMCQSFHPCLAGSVVVAIRIILN